MARKWLPLSGVAFVVLMLVVIVGFSGETPGTDDSGAKIASFYDDEGVRQGIAAFLLAATVPFLLLFAAALAGLAGAVDRAWREIWRRMLLGGSFILGAIIMVMALIHFALVDGADNVDPAAVQALNLLDGNFWVAANPALGVMMLGAGGWLLGRPGQLQPARLGRAGPRYRALHPVRRLLRPAPLTALDHRHQHRALPSATRRARGGRDDVARSEGEGARPSPER